MSDAVTVGLIAAASSIASAAISAKATQIRIKQDMAIHQAVTDTKIEELTREVREHNGFAHRVPVLEEKVRALEERSNNGGH